MQHEHKVPALEHENPTPHCRKLHFPNWRNLAPVQESLTSSPLPKLSPTTLVEILSGMPSLKPSQPLVETLIFRTLWDQATEKINP